MADDTEIFVESSLKERLLKYYTTTENANDVVFLCGNVYEGSMFISGCLNSTILKASVDGRSLECELIPKGVKFLGIYNSSPKYKELDIKSAQRLLKELLSQKMNDRINEHLLLWQHCLETSSHNGRIYNVTDSKLCGCQLQFGSYMERFSQTFLTFRLQTAFDICFGNNFKGLNHKIIKITKELLQSESTTFLIKDCNIFLNYETTQDKVKQTCADMLGLMGDSQSQDSHSMENRKTKSRKNDSKSTSKTAVKDAIDVQLLTKVSMSINDHKENTMVPTICYGEEFCTNISMSLPVDVVVMATKNTMVTELPRLFKSAVVDQLKHIQNVIQGFSKTDNWCLTRPYHFKPPGFSYYVTVIYPEINSHGEGFDNKELELYRTEIHKQLILPTNRPLLRICNRYTFEKDRKPDLYLINPHSSISYSGCGTVGLVDGLYSYHHYMQDNFNDDKWGCAYRSLQTIFSWFRHQGYTSKPVPGHRQIQQALVDVGDKKSNFVGSRQWIGSFEVNLCLEHLLGITSKIMFVSSGAEMRSKGRELLHHFETQGTPIMIGGGVLAHTIIGVDYNQQTGDIKFLILDPHYTGSEDIKIILDKGWCGWKGPGFWDQQAHYNMCMPQRPDVI